MQTLYICFRYVGASTPALVIATMLFIFPSKPPCRVLPGETCKHLKYGLLIKEFNFNIYWYHVSLHVSDCIDFDILAFMFLYPFFRFINSLSFTCLWHFTVSGNLEPLMDLQTFMKKVPWHILLLFGGGMAIADGCEVGELGIASGVPSKIDLLFPWSWMQWEFTNLPVQMLDSIFYWNKDQMNVVTLLSA